MMKKTMLFALVLAALMIVYSAVTAQTPPDPAAAQAPAATPIPQIMTQPISSVTAQQQGCAPSITTTALSADTFVSVKDQGDAQTVLIYKIDDQGNVRLTSKKKYMY